MERSLHDQVLISLGMEERPDAVEQPWKVMVETNAQTPQELLPDTTILSLFDQMGAGRTLLILGEPGSGKTNTLLQLARDLISRAEQDADQLIPIVFNLSSWKPTRKQNRKTVSQSISDWLVEELNTKYQVPQKIAAKWIKQQQLLLLLDGLDEVKADERNACVKALNAFQQEAGTEMVVCCRIKDYQALMTRLRCQTAIYLRPLTLPQIQSYLRLLRASLTGLTHLLAVDTALQELAQSPLMLNIMVVAYQGVAISDLPQTQVIEERRTQLFNAYIQRMLRHRGISLGYPSEKFLNWLVWLAQRMVQNAQTVFLIENMQPHWLEPENRKLYRVGATLSFGLSGGLIGGLSGGLSGGLILGLILGLIGGLSEKVKTVEKLKWSWQESRRGLSGGLNGGLFFGLIGGLILGLFFGLFFGLSGGLIFGLSVGLIGGLSVGLILGLSGGLIFGLFFGLSGGLSGGLTSVEIEATTILNQGIWNSAKNFGFFGLSGGLIFGLILGLIGGLSGGLIFGLFFGLIFGLIFGLEKGGQACIQHFTLRLILYRSGRSPWNYAKFLDLAAKILFLQRVGGGYIFIHRLLLEHFAQLDPEAIQQLSK